MLPSGYTAPTAGFNYNNSVAYGYCSVGYQYTPQIVVNSNISDIIGFSQATFPSTPSTTTTNVLSDITPNASPVNSIVVRSNLVNNPLTSPSDILTSFSINGSFGSNLIYEPNYEQYIALSRGTYSSIIVSFQDQNFNSIQANDPNVSICLIIKNKKKQNKIETITPTQKTNETPPIKKIVFDEPKEEE